ncbi:MAG: hypothetical protein ACRD2B_14905 [Terriglobia bacterium]
MNTERMRNGHLRLIVAVKERGEAREVTAELVLDAPGFCWRPVAASSIPVA